MCGSDHLWVSHLERQATEMFAVIVAVGLCPQDGGEVVKVGGKNLDGAYEARVQEVIVWVEEQRTQWLWT